ncbi:MAG: periplasmic heavy metal sensor [Alphaproteobacteria bacterium]|nr:periplasmic heavy metal sensor [Alphaproteobacteria bacterium]
MAFLGNRWVGWALIVSLALNLFLGAVVGMRYWREHQRSSERAMMGPMGRIAAGLPESGRAKVKAVMEGRQAQIREQSREFRRARSEAMQTLAAEPFDKAKAEAAFVEARRRANAMSELMQSTMIEASAQLTPEERKAFRERMAERERRWAERSRRQDR